MSIATEDYHEAISNQVCAMTISWDWPVCLDDRPELPLRREASTFDAAIGYALLRASDLEAGSGYLLVEGPARIGGLHGLTDWGRQLDVAIRKHRNLIKHVIKRLVCMLHKLA